MINKANISANGIRQHFRYRKGGEKKAVFIHGNGSDSVFWEELMESMPSEYTCIAPDLRGYGLTEAVPARAENSYGDFVDDIIALLAFLEIDSYIVFGHSLGGGIAWELLIRDHQRIEKLVLVNPASPFGFGGTCDKKGTLTYSDGAGSGAGVINPDFVKLLRQGYRENGEASAPINVMNNFYWEPPFVPARIDDLLDGLLRMKVGDQFYPGDSSPSSNFPFTAPGKFGQINAAAPISKKDILESLASLPKGIKVLWIRGGKDKIVSDESMFDTAVLGKLGLIPDYPGEEKCKPQPMVAQTRYALEEMAADYHEEVMEDCGHSPYIEDLNGFMKIVKKHILE